MAIHDRRTFRAYERNIEEIVSESWRSVTGYECMRVCVCVDLDVIIFLSRRGLYWSKWHTSVHFTNAGRGCPVTIKFHANSVKSDLCSAAQIKRSRE